MDFLVVHMMKRCKPLILLLLLVAPGTVLAKEVLRLVVWEGYAPEAQRLQFQDYIRAKYNMDVKLEVDYIEDIEDYFSALRLKRGDILSPTHSYINDERFRMIELGLILPVNLNNIPNYSDIDPAFKNPDYLIRDTQHYGIPFSFGPYALAYNTARFDQPPTSWSILWDPEYRNQFSITDYGEMNIYITGLVLGYPPEELHNYDRFNNEIFINKLSELAQNAQSFWVGVDTVDDLQGLPLATSWGFALPALKQRGETWKLATIREGTPGWIDNFVISHSLKNRPKLKRIAEEWINFTISPEFQAEVLINGLGVHAVNPKTAKLLTAEQVEKFHFNQPDYLDNFILMPTLDRRTRNGMDVIWQQVAADEIKRKKTVH